MLTFKQLREQYVLLLTEDRIDFLKQQFKDGLSTEHDPSAKAKTSDKIIDHFANKADPTSGKLHTNWLINQYRKGSIRQNDAASLKGTLGDFEKVKNKLEKNDINAYKSVDELRDAVATQKPRAEAEAKSKKETASKRGADMEKVYDQDGVYGFKVPNKEVSVKNYGPAGKLCQSRWCTAAAGRNNMWDRYSGGKYTMHLPNGHVLQIHHQTGQLKDLSNREIGDDDVRYSPYAKHIANFIKKTGELEGERNSELAGRFHTYSPEETDSAIQKYADSDKGRYEANSLHPVLSKANLSPEQLKKVRSFDGENTYFKGEKLSKVLLRNPNLSTEELDKTHKKFESDDGGVPPTEFYSNPNLKGDLLNKVFAHEYSDKGTRIRRESLAQYNPNLQDSHINHIIKNSPNEHVELTSNNGITLSKEHQKSLLASATGQVKNKIAQRADVHPDTVDHLVKKASEGDPNSDDVSATDHLIRNPNVQLSKDHIDKILNSGRFRKDHMSGLFDSHHTAVDDETRNKIADKLTDNTNVPGYPTDAVFDSKKFTADHLEKFMKSHPDQVAKHPKATTDQLHRLIADHGDKHDVQENMLGNQKAVKPEHLKALSDKIDGAKQTSNWDTFFKHKNVTPDVLHHVYDNTSNPAIKGAVLHHPSVQLSHFNKATNEGDMKLHGAISSSPSAPPTALHKMADSPFQYVKMNVIKHKNTGQDTFKKLAGSEDTTVADAAAKKVKA